MFYFKVALRWLLQKENVPSLVIGVKSLEQLEDNFGSLGWSLTKEDMDELDLVKIYVKMIHPCSDLF